MSADALFERDTVRGTTCFVPTSAAVGPWDPRLVHGAAVAALLAGQLTPADATLARLTVDILAPVPLEPLAFEAGEPLGGARVRRRQATLTAEGRVVASATSLLVRRTELDLPGRAMDPNPFPTGPLTSTEPNRAAAEVIGWESFDSLAVVLERAPQPEGASPKLRIALAVPVVAGAPLLGTEVAAVAADYAQTAVHLQLPYDRWSFRNAELSMHLAREPLGGWIGMRAESVVGSGGAGFNAADLYDGAGRVGRSASALVLEARPGR